MAFSRSHLITISTYSLLVFIPYYAASLSFNLTNIHPQNQNRDIRIEGAGAYISDSGVHLTPDQSGSNRTWQAGRMTYIRPLHLWDKTSRELASFDTNFSFVIDSNMPTYGDGLAFLLAENNSELTPSAAMGRPLNFQSVSVEFDTFWNSGWDPTDSSNTSIGDHVGININSLNSSSYQKWFSDVTGGRECQAWITYDSVSKNLSVSFTGFRNNAVERQVGLYYTIDLRDELPEQVIFGFSAGTGGLYQTNNIRSWTFNSSDLQVDPGNPGPDPPNPGPDPGNDNNNRLAPNPGPGPDPDKAKLVGLIVGPSVLIIFLAVLAFVLWRRKKKRREDEAEELGFPVEMNNEFEMGTGPKRFSYHELARSTSGFAKSEKLGEGGFGGVYKGFLEDSSTYVAVKRISKGSKQGIKEYASEVRIISRLRHRNLVQLTGWCHEKGELLLVYEFMENGSLDSHLFKAKSLLTWGTRYKIAHGMASALQYLHEEWEQCVLHRDIKSSNVMLDSNFNAKLGDFGLAKLVDHEKGSLTTMLAGTLGYMAPECVVTGKASKKSDVFSFGVVALEIACGRKPIEHLAQENQVGLVGWVWDLYGTGTLLEAADPRLDSNFEEEEIKRLMILGLWCVHPDPDIRPSIRQVIQVLNSEASMPILPSKMPVASYLAPHMSQYGDTFILQSGSSE